MVNSDMKKLSVISLLVSLLFVFSCEDKVEKDTTPPEVTITSPSNGSTVSIIVSITCMSSDDKGVERVDLWVNGQPIGVSDTTEPYSMEWNTITYDDGSYGVTVRSYDTSGNTTDSDPITLTVYKTVSFGGQDYSVDNSPTTLSCRDCGHIGEIPPEIGYLTNLTELRITNNNQITGEIPPEIGNLTKLTHLELFNNQITGEIPVEIGNLTNLDQLILFGNQLTGGIPIEIMNLTKLNYLTLGSNQLTGGIPVEIGNLTNLKLLELHGNQLTGEIPVEIKNLTNLEYLRLNTNQLTGKIPESICDLNIDWSNNSKFNISNNQLCPSYPSCIQNYVGTQDTTNCG